MNLFKKTKSFLQIFLSAAIVFSVFALQPIKAQTPVTLEEFDGKALLISFPSTNLDSTETIYSTEFSLAGFDYNLFTSTPVYWSRLLSSTTGKPRVLQVIQGTNTPLITTSWQVVDTLSVLNDSTETWGNGNINFNSKKFAYYRHAITGTAGNRADTYVQNQIYIPYKKRN